MSGVYVNTVQKIKVDLYLSPLNFAIPIFIAQNLKIIINEWWCDVDGDEFRGVFVKVLLHWLPNYFLFISILLFVLLQTLKLSWCMLIILEQFNCENYFAVLSNKDEREIFCLFCFSFPNIDCETKDKN